MSQVLIISWMQPFILSYVQVWFLRTYFDIDSEYKKSMEEVDSWLKKKDFFLLKRKHWNEKRSLRLPGSEGKMK